jgi:hypothetical protein
MMDRPALDLPERAITPAELSGFRSSQPDCVLALWIDIDAKIVLAADGALRHPQEALDAHCSAGARALSCPPLEGDASPDHIVFAGSMETRVLLRDAARPSQALICICPPALDPGPLMEAMNHLLAKAREMGAPA